MKSLIWKKTVILTSSSLLPPVVGSRCEKVVIASLKKLQLALKRNKPRFYQCEMSRGLKKVRPRASCHKKLVRAQKLISELHKLPFKVLTFSSIPSVWNVLMQIWLKIFLRPLIIFDIRGPNGPSNFWPISTPAWELRRIVVL